MSKRSNDPGYAAGWCIHFRSMGKHDTCEQNVEYSSFRGPEKTFVQHPCFLTEKGESKPGALACPLLRRPTPEEISDHEKWISQRFGKLRIVMTGIKPWRDKNEGRSVQEIVECPCCKGKLHLSIAAYNGHVHGKCETEGCVSWME